MPEMIEVTIDFPKLRAALRRLIAAGGDLTPVMRESSGIMADAVEENFEQEGRPKWKSLAASTLRQRAKEGSTGKILQRRGNLARSITRHYDANSAIVGTNSVYAAIHNFGGKAGRGRKVEIPAREHLHLEPEDENAIVKSFARFLGEAVG